jgi:hypothetical protein
MLERRTALNAYDRDCLILFNSASDLRRDAYPGYKWIATTPFYKHGKRISEALYGVPLPYNLDPEMPRRTIASILFEMVHDRVPNPGEILRYEEVAEHFSPEEVAAKVQEIQGAWARRISEYPCPFKYESGKMLVCQTDGSWQADWLQNPAALWRFVEGGALGWAHISFGQEGYSHPPTIRAVVFVNSRDGKRNTAPVGATAEGQ